MRSITARAIVDKDLCTGCKACIGLCPTDAISIKNGTASVVPLFCMGCGFCLEDCGEEAIRIIEYVPM